MTNMKVRLSNLMTKRAQGFIKINKKKIASKRNLLKIKNFMNHLKIFLNFRVFLFS